MARIDDLLAKSLKSLPVKPDDGATQATKKRYSEMVSQQIALALAAELRLRGLREARPGDVSTSHESGAERRMAGGLGAKKVDVTWATEDSGLLCAKSSSSASISSSSTLRRRRSRFAVSPWVSRKSS